MPRFFLGRPRGESSGALELEEGGAGGIGWEQGLGVVGDCVVGRWSRDWVVDSEAAVAAVVWADSESRRWWSGGGEFAGED